MNLADLRAHPHLRNELRAAINDHARARIKEAHARRYCIGCGGYIDNYTTNCRTCIDRRYSRQRRGRGPA